MIIYLKAWIRNFIVFIKPKNGLFLSKFCIDLLIIINTDLLEIFNDNTERFQVSIDKIMWRLSLILGNFLDSASYIDRQLQHQLECPEIWISLLKAQ